MERGSGAALDGLSGIAAGVVLITEIDYIAFALLRLPVGETFGATAALRVETPARLRVEFPAMSLAIHLAVELAWFVGAFSGSWLAGRLAGRRPMLHGWIAGATLLALGIADLVEAPQALTSFWVSGVAPLSSAPSWVPPPRRAE